MENRKLEIEHMVEKYNISYKMALQKWKSHFVTLELPYCSTSTSFCPLSLQLFAILVDHNIVPSLDLVTKNARELRIECGVWK